MKCQSYSKDSVGALTKGTVIWRVDRGLSSEPRVKLAYVCLITLSTVNTSTLSFQSASSVSQLRMQVRSGFIKRSIS